MEVVEFRLGEEALLHMEVQRVVEILLLLKAKKIEEAGGLECWEQLSDEEKLAANMSIIRSVGKKVFKNLPSEDSRKLSQFIRTGCCMHKDLNTVKGGDKAMQDWWESAGKKRPLLLANRNNAAVLANCMDTTNMTAAEKQAGEISKRGGSHATALGGMIFRNKDKKKGQQDTYNIFMENRVGHHVPYPDVSNTRYGTHGEAAGTIIAYQDHFISFMEFIRDAKDKPGFTNIEKNFYDSLTNTETVTEFVVLAAYNVGISKPFMGYVRRHDNILEMQSFFEKKVKFLESIIQNPNLWIGPDVLHKTGSLNGEEWDQLDTKIMKSIQKLAPDLPDLSGALVAFLQGAKETFSERFSDEFNDDSEIKKLSAAERDSMFFASTNDVNEGALGSWWLGQRKWPRETVHKFGAAFVRARNDTEAFQQTHLTKEVDQAYLRRTAREVDRSGYQKNLKDEQMKADGEKVAENCKKVAKRQERRENREAAIVETGKNLVLDDADIDRLIVKDLNKQLDFHRDEEKKNPGPDSSEKVPLTSHMRNRAERVAALKKAVARFISKHGTMTGPTMEETPVATARVEPLQDDPFYESDWDDDLI